MVKQNSATGQRVVICGAGPSLAVEHARLPDADQVWACNSALPYLMERGVRVTHAVTVDQNAVMMSPEEWGRCWPVEYLLASCVHPSVPEQLSRAGRRLRWFHSYQGVSDPPQWDAKARGHGYEWHLYTSLYPGAVQVGYGLNTAVRAVCLAVFMGFAEIMVLGADCACAPDAPPMPQLGTADYAAWMQCLQFYADGRPAAVYGDQESMLEAVIDGTRWHSRADMIVSARMLVEMAEKDPRIRLVGRTLPAAIWPHRHDAAWMADLPTLEPGGMVLNIRKHEAVA
jgi:hypothetical protein